MMGDREVHFHVIPRYSKPRQWNGIEFPDAGWPGPPQLKIAIEIGSDTVSTMTHQLKPLF